VENSLSFLLKKYYHRPFTTPVFKCLCWKVKRAGVLLQGFIRRLLTIFISKETSPCFVYRISGNGVPNITSFSAQPSVEMERNLGREYATGGWYKKA
jgi:hypothetical protein